MTSKAPTVDGSMTTIEQMDRGDDRRFLIAATDAS